MYIELNGYIVEPPEFEMGEGGDFSYNSHTPSYEPLLLNSETVTLITPADDGMYALIFLTDGLVVASQEPFDVIKNIFKRDYLVIKTSDN